MQRILRRLRAAAVPPEVGGPAGAVAAAANPMRTLAALGLAAAVLFLGLTIVSLGGGSSNGGEGQEAEVLGAEAGPPAPVRGEMEVASTDGGAFFVYAEDPMANVAGSATVIVQGEGDVSLTVAGTPRDDRAVISATVRNDTAVPIVFAGGLTVVVDILRDGLPWRTVEPSDRSVTELAPGGAATVTTEIALDGFGEYELTGEVAFARR